MRIMPLGRIFSVPSHNNSWNRRLAFEVLHSLGTATADDGQIFIEFRAEGDARDEWGGEYVVALDEWKSWSITKKRTFIHDVLKGEFAGETNEHDHAEWVTALIRALETTITEATVAFEGNYRNDG